MIFTSYQGEVVYMLTTLDSSSGWMHGSVSLVAAAK